MECCDLFCGMMKSCGYGGFCSEEEVKVWKDM
jgi:hypothetical protein